MPMTPKMRRGVDQIRDYLYGGGYPDPITNAEQLAFLFFFYLVEGIDRDNAVRAKAAGQPLESIYDGEWKLRNPLNAPSQGVETIPKECRTRASTSASRSPPPLIGRAYRR